MVGVGIEILVEDTTRSSRAAKGKRRQTKTRKRTKKRRSRAMVQRTGGVARGAKRPRRGAPGAEGLREGAPEIGRPRKGAPRARGPRGGASGAGGPASWSSSAFLLSSAFWSSSWRVFALATQVFAFAARFWCCFSLFSRLFFSQESSSLSLLSLTAAIASATALSF